MVGTNDDLDGDSKKFQGILLISLKKSDFSWIQIKSLIGCFFKKTLGASTPKAAERILHTIILQDDPSLLKVDTPQKDSIKHRDVSHILDDSIYFGNVK